MDEMWVIYFFVFVVGACFGSFLNVVALRAITQESIVFPSSKCPKCATPIKWYDNIPILSYLLTFRGKCRSCGCHVSKQYPIVEALTATIFLAIVFFCGLTLKSLFLIILACISIVISITDIKEQNAYDVHLWILIITSISASLYFQGLNNYLFVVLGIVSGIVIMELLARVSYYLVTIRTKNKEENTDIDDSKENNQVSHSTTNSLSQSECSTTENEQDIEITQEIKEYIHKDKRMFGLGDTYIVAAIGALLGWQGVIISIILAITLQAILVAPQYIVSLFKQNEKILATLIVIFISLSSLYYLLNNIYKISENIQLIFIILLVLIAFVIIKKLRTRLNEDINTNISINAIIPFGPALLISMFIGYFYGAQILKYVFG